MSILVTRRSPAVPAHVATTRHLCAAYPLVSEAGLGHEGVLIGRDLLGGSFVYDPFALYRHGVVTNPNTVVFGQIGRGKSSFVKTYLWRQAVFGRHAWVVDPKGEYGPLAEAWGAAPVALRPGGTIRLNPLDTADAVSAGGPDTVDDADRRRAVLTASLAVACLGRELLPRERAAIDVALGEASVRAGAARMRAPTWSRRCSILGSRRPGHCGPPGPFSWRTAVTWLSSSAASCTVTSAACSTGRPATGCASTGHWWCSTCPPSTIRRPWVS